MKAGQSPPFTAEDLELSKKLVPGIQIMRIMVVSSNYFRDPIIDEIPALQMRVDINSNVNVFVSAERQAWSMITLSIKGVPISPGPEEKIAFSIETQVEIRYDAKAVEIPAEDLPRALNAFCHFNSPLHTWSFFRQHIHDAMSRMLLPPIDLPIYPAYEQGVPIPSSKRPRPKKA